MIQRPYKSLFSFLRMLSESSPNQPTGKHGRISNALVSDRGPTKKHAVASRRILWLCSQETFLHDHNSSKQGLVWPLAYAHEYQKLVFPPEDGKLVNKPVFLQLHAHVHLWQRKHNLCILQHSKLSDVSSKIASDISFMNLISWSLLTNEPPHDKTNKMACALSEDSDQPGHPPSPISSLSAWIKLGFLATHWAHSEDWSDWADAQADLSLRWAHKSLCWFWHAAAQTMFNPFVPWVSYWDLGKKCRPRSARSGQDHCLNTWFSHKNKIEMKKVHQTHLKWKKDLSKICTDRMDRRVHGA